MSDMNWEQVEQLLRTLNRIAESLEDIANRLDQISDDTDRMQIAVRELAEHSQGS